MENFRLIVLTTIIYLGLTISPTLATPILNINVDGQLVGASDIEINGSLFNVEFLDGTCIELFNGCEQSTDFFWTTQADAMNASLALGSQIFNSLNPIFNSSPELIYGCTSTLECDIRSIFGLDVGQPNLVQAYNYSNRGGVNNLIQPWIFDRNTELASPITSYALWSTATVTPTPSPVPVTAPQTLGLFFLGLIGMVLRRVNSPLS